MTSQECEQYLHRIISGDQLGLQNIYENYHHAVFAVALSILKDYQESEDAVQEIFIKIWNKAETYRFGSNPKTWIMRITRNHCLDIFKKRKHEIPEEDNNSIFESCNNHIDDSVLMKVDIERALSLLSDIERQIFILHAVGQISYLSISHILSIPLATVAWKYSQSVKKLKLYFNFNERDISYDIQKENRKHLL